MTERHLKKMLNIISHQRNENQNNSEIPSYTCKNVQDQKHYDNLSWRGCEVKGTLLHYWWECKLVQPLWISVWRFLRKVGNNLPWDPAIPLLGTSKGYSIVPKGHVRNYVYSSIVCHSQNLEITKMLLNQRIKKWKICTMEYYTIEKIMTFWILQQIDGSRKHHIEWGNSDLERQLW